MTPARRRFGSIQASGQRGGVRNDFGRHQIALIVLVLAASLDANAQSVCRIFEYAEMRDMRKERLESLYCEYQGDMLDMPKIALDEARRGHTLASNEAMSIGNRCAQEIDRIEAVLDAKFGASKLHCVRGADRSVPAAETPRDPTPIAPAMADTFGPMAARFAATSGCSPPTPAGSLPSQTHPGGIAKFSCPGGAILTVQCDASACLTIK